MREGWTYKTFRDVCFSISDGDWIEKKDQSPDGIRLIQTGNIGVGRFIPKDDSKKFISLDTFKRLRCTEIKEGDILISRLPQPLGRSCVLPKLETRCITAVDCCILRLNSKITLPQYFIYYTQSQNYFSEINSQSSGTTRARITRKKLEETKIPVAPLSEQKAIVSRLDSAFAKIDALKANAKKQLDDAKALFQKALEKAMEPKEGWEEKTIGDLFKTYAGGTPLKSGDNYYEGGTIPWIRSGEVCKKYINDCELYITEEGMKNSSAKYYPVNTILVAMYGATAAQVGILKFEATSNQAVCGILPRKDFVPEFIYYWFVNIQKELASQAQGGAQPNLSQVKIKKVLLSYPSLSEQQAIVAHLDQLSEKVKRLQEIQEKTIKECDALKQAILREVFE